MGALLYLIGKSLNGCVYIGECACMFVFQKERIFRENENRGNQFCLEQHILNHNVELDL